MLKQHSQFFKNLMLVNDLCFVSLAWWGSYVLRFHATIFPSPDVYIFYHYVIAWFLILLVWAIVFELLDLYRPRRISTHRREIAEIIKGSSLALLVFLGLLFLLRNIILSRIVVLLFWVSSVPLLNFSHIAFREGLRFLRRKGYNLRHVVIIGSASQAKELIQKLDLHRRLGLRVLGLHPIPPACLSQAPGGVPLLMTREEVLSLTRSGKVDQIFIALPLEEAGKLREILDWLGDEPVAVHFVPDLAGMTALRGRVEEFDGLHIVSLRDSSVYGWNSFLKRAMDLLLGGLAFVVFSPLMLLVALAIKWTSPGHLFFRQERMGLDGKRFQILKFRTMIDNAENKTGAVWTIPGDPRVTPIGRWLRRTSFDELPQLINVLKGEMSLVGPRPERPPLVEEFRRMLPDYMLRHRVKAGMPGWAQVNGWRGKTSLRERIEHDIFYIKNWSLRLDLRILALTLLRGFLHKNAY